MLTWFLVYLIATVKTYENNLTVKPLFCQNSSLSNRPVKIVDFHHVNCFCLYTYLSIMHLIIWPVSNYLAISRKIKAETHMTDHLQFYRVGKGQVISEYKFDVSNFPKNNNQKIWWISALESRNWLNWKTNYVK